jgi:hypothetical protein
VGAAVIGSAWGKAWGMAFGAAWGTVTVPALVPTAGYEAEMGAATERRAYYPAAGAGAMVATIDGERIATL